MKYKLLQLSLISMFVMLFGGLAQAADPEVTLDFTGETDWGIPTSGTNRDLASFTDGTYTIKLYSTKNYKQNDGYLILGEANSYLELPAFDFDVEKIQVVGHSGASGSVKQNIYVGDVAVSTETIGANGITNTYNIAEAYQAAGNIYKFVVNSDHNTQIDKILIFKKSSTEITDGYYVVGNMTNWVVDANYKMALNEGAGTEEYSFTMDLTTESQLKVVKVDGETQTWYPEGMGNNYGENGEITKDGNYTIYFRPNADGGNDWFYDVIYVASNEEPEEVIGDVYYQKVTSTGDITNGQYLIVYEGDATHDAVAFNGGLTTLDAVGNGVAVSIIDGKIPQSEARDAALFTIDIPCRRRCLYQFIITIFASVINTNTSNGNIVYLNCDFAVDLSQSYGTLLTLRT